MLVYLFIRLLTFPFAFLSVRAIHALAKPLGTLAYYLFPKFRKRSLSNLSLAYALNLKPNEIQACAKQSFQSLIATLLEYPKLARVTDLSNIVTLDNPENAENIMAQGKGAIFFCGHQANWELLFLEGTRRMPGVAIGRPIKNKFLYQWIQNIRQKFGGKIVPPKQGIKEAIRALKKGYFIGIVGDQGMPGSGFSCPFLGRRAWTSPLPALLSYKTNTPILVATTTFRDGKYHIHLSDPILPDLTAPKKEEIPRLMKKTLALFEESIKKNPHEWLWIHNRWKQQTRDKLKKPFRHDSIALILSEKIDNLESIRTLYPTEEITLFAPDTIADTLSLDAHIHPLSALSPNYQYKVIFNLTNDPHLTRPFKRYAHTIAHPKSLEEIKTMVRRA